MNTLALKPRVFTPGILSFLAQQGLVRPLVPTSNVLRCRRASGAAGTVYASAPRHGTHKLLSVRCTTGPIRLNYHEDHEEFILIHPQARLFNPLFMIIGLHKYEIMRFRADTGTLSASDFMALRLVYNDPLLSIFTMLRDTPHFEIAACGRKQAPVFFVTEPSRLKLCSARIPGYRLALEGNGT